MLVLRCVAGLDLGWVMIRRARLGQGTLLTVVPIPRPSKYNVERKASEKKVVGAVSLVRSGKRRRRYVGMEQVREGRSVLLAAPCYFLLPYCAQVGGNNSPLSRFPRPFGEYVNE